MTAEELENAITDKTVTIILNSPSNPTGAIYTEEELKKLAVIIEKYNLTVISDEIYEKLVYGDAKHYSIACASDYMKENTVVINGVSKTYAMTGWRIGYLAASEKLASVITKVQGHTTSNACSFAQYASVTAMLNGAEIVENMRKEFDDRRKYMLKRADELGLEYISPNGAFYLFINIKKFIGKSVNGKVIDGSMSFASLLTENGVAVIPGLPFYADDFIRLSYTVSIKDIEEGFNRIAKFLSLIK
jgi:aspartate aminotransferase